MTTQEALRRRAYVAFALAIVFALVSLFFLTVHEIPG
jgi:hypothetical protein